MAVDYIYADVDIDFDRGRDGDLIKDTDLNAVTNSIRNILQTSKGTRRMLPEFGASLDFFLFEPIDRLTGQKIGSAIYDEILAWEDRIVIDSIDIKADEDNYQYNIKLTYHLKGLEEMGVISIGFILQQS